MARASRRTPAAAEPILHHAARIEDAYHAFREKRARRRGRVATVIPYAGYGGAGWIRVLCRVLLTAPGATADEELGTANRNVRGWRSFTSVPVDDVTVIVTAGGQEFRVKAGRGGVVDARIDVDLPAGWNTIQIRTDESDDVEAPVHVVDPNQRFGLLSDIDDTVMVTALPRPFLAAWNTFVLNEHARRPVAGMAVLYERLVRAHPGAPVIYLSTGAWNVAPTLTRFLSRNLYPSGALLLTDWGPTHDRWFRSGRDHKHSSLRRIAAEFPDIRWLLVGDDGQHDEELYGDFLREHESSVSAVCIRQLSPGEAVLAGGRSERDGNGEGVSVPWLSAPDGAGLVKQLEHLTLLPESKEL
ncbi:phosphatidate phosphatase APP1 [Glaciihabitans tibetensis]|uniref:Phosphatidate phosphatase APP1 n=1 Tax=Glaciihabitans tibetensis TaxID=1266600 RepID=A0A2T0VIY2_9MICO|nr:phosphatase domain-containing protein [Glaciihabitans tibetensis]PRY70179.1 phosphatidate phosphatase APP1 [Glaciihabitans tibetensis]